MLAAGATLLALGLATACGGSDDAGSGDASITVWHGYTDVEAKGMTQVVADWNGAHPSQQVKLVYNGGNDNTLQKTTAAIAAGKYPDVAYQFGSSATALVKKKHWST
ncbi:hypothetical protein GCM10025868_19860 [Angustibacter aerolatus]|uniref:Extracellular solute-binding protein n=1 Tax=Angustibacter aerolatus TaxID=1162965 RepID=A0ABQ6JIW3_9ACTN|nr:hypothetical protein GCM10025868_19860 [Angustibacter aerolatus]